MKLSASQINKYRACPRMYAFEYVEHQFPPSNLKQEFGSKVHKHLERWLKSGIVPPETPEGLVAKQGISNRALPIPGPTLQLEYEFQIRWIEDVVMKGFIDCAYPKEHTVIDHKTTSSAKYIKTSEGLQADPQALIYATWAALYWRVLKVKARWIYYIATNPKNGIRKPGGVRTVETIFDIKSIQFHKHLKKLLEDSSKMIKIRKEKIRGLDFTPSPESCDNFGGCFHRNKCTDIKAVDILAASFKRI
jgi:RecB family exonuclease